MHSPLSTTRDPHRRCPHSAGGVADEMGV
jgi:hypothetical protein